LARLKRACASKGFAQLRDAAIIAVLRATGIRLAELAGNRHHPGDPRRSDLDLWNREIAVTGKGRKTRAVKSGWASLPRRLPRLAVEIISDKWAVLVLFGLSHQPRRHGEPAGLIGGISRKVLTQTLRRLQQYGLVERHAEAPRRVEYNLTDLGRTLVEPIEVLTSWARDYGGAIADFQEAAQAATSARARAEG
jgi:DNA-binding HxlR family transcriptional regulator